MLIKLLTMLSVAVVLFSYSNYSKAEIAILTSESHVNTSYSGVIPVEYSELGTISYPISGMIMFNATEGYYEWFTGKWRDGNITLENISINPFEYENRKWEFPTFIGFVEGEEGKELVGSEDPCFWQRKTIGGSCWSYGDFGWYSGSLSDEYIIIDGGKEYLELYGDTYPNDYYYHIEAKIIKEYDFNTDGEISIHDIVLGLQILSGSNSDKSKYYKYVKNEDMISMTDILSLLNVLMKE